MNQIMLTEHAGLLGEVAQFIWLKNPRLLSLQLLPDITL